MISLIIETSTERGFALFCNGQNIIHKAEIPYGLNSSKHLLPEIERGFKAAGLKPADLNTVAVGIGPGSYTGIRVGAIVAKTFVYTLKIPLITFSTLEPYLAENESGAIIDAKIGGFYVQRKEDLLPVVLPLDQLGSFFESTKQIASPNTSLLKAKIESAYPGRWLIQEKDPDVDYMVMVISGKYKKQEFTDANLLELHYLRKTQAEIESQS